MFKYSIKIKPNSAKAKLRRFRNHPFIIPITTFMVLFFVVIVGLIGISGTTVGATDTRVVSLNIDGKQQTLPTRAKTVGDLLQRLNITLGDQDIVKPDADTPIEDENFTISVYKARPVLVIDGDKKTVTYTAEPTPEGVVQKVGLTVYPEDTLTTKPVESVSATDVLRQGIVAEQVVIDRATPANLNLYGTPVNVRSHAKTVGQLLAEKGVKLNDGDTLRPDPSTPLSENMEVFVVRVGKEIAQVEESIEQPTEYVDDYNQTLGSTTVQDPGQAGKKLVTYEIEQQNGIEVSRRIIQEVVAQEPVKKIVTRGKRAPVVAGNKSEIMAAAGISANEYYAADFIISHESGWRVNALNARGCGGLGQACPATKLAAACPNWQSDPVCQMKFFNKYAVGRYGSWTRAMETWQMQRWW